MYTSSSGKHCKVEEVLLPPSLEINDSPVYSQRILSSPSQSTEHKELKLPACFLSLPPEKEPAESKDYVIIMVIFPGASKLPDMQ